jgi:molybdopterin converting factor small subunit
MPTLVVPSLLRPLCGGAGRLELNGSTLGDVLRAADARCPGFFWRVVEDGRVRPELAVAIDGEAGSFALHEPLPPGAEIAIVPAIGGGSPRYGRR